MKSITVRRTLRDEYRDRQRGRIAARAIQEQVSGFLDDEDIALPGPWGNTLHVRVRAAGGY